MNFDDLKLELQNIPEDTKILVTVPFPDPNISEKEYEVTASDLKAIFSIPKTNTYKIVPGGVNVRALPDITSLKLTELSGGISVKSSFESNDFIKIDAYISKKFVIDITNPPVEHMYAISSVRVRQSESTNSLIIDSFGLGDGLMVQGANFDGKWTWAKIIDVDSGHKTAIGGFIAREFLSSNKPTIQSPTPITTKSKIGLHLYPPIGPDLIPFLKELYFAGRPLAGVTLLKANADITIADIKAASPSTDVVVRLFGGTDEQVNPNNWPILTRQDGINYFNNKVRPALATDVDLKNADAIQPFINEPGYDIKGTPAFWNGMLDASKGVCALVVFLFGVGIPPLPTSPDDYPFWTNIDVINLANRVATEIPISGKFHRFDVHQYVNPNLPRPRNWNDTFTILRHQRIMQVNQAYRNVKWVFSELGDEKMPEQGADYFISQVRLWDSLVANDINVMHGDLWTYIKKDYPVNANWGTDNISVFLDQLKTYLLS